MNANLKYLEDNILPNHSESERSGIKKMISDGCVNPIVYVWDNYIVDGILVFEICKELNLKYDVIHIDFKNIEEAIKWRVEKHLYRRNMNKAQRIQAALKLKEYYIY